MNQSLFSLYMYRSTDIVRDMKNRVRKEYLLPMLATQIFHELNIHISCVFKYICGVRSYTMHVTFLKSELLIKEHSQNMSLY